MRPGEFSTENVHPGLGQISHGSKSRDAMDESGQLGQFHRGRYLDCFVLALSSVKDNCGVDAVFLA